MKHKPLIVARASTEVSIRLPAGVPEAVKAIVESALVIHGEDVSAYEALFAELASTVRPSDIVEWIWVKEMAEVVWAGQRNRRVLRELFEWKSTAATVPDDPGRDPLAFLKELGYDKIRE